MSDTRNAVSQIYGHLADRDVFPEGLLYRHVVVPDGVSAPLQVRTSEGTLLQYATTGQQDVFCVGSAHERVPDAPLLVHDSTLGFDVDGCSFDVDWTFDTPEGTFAFVPGFLGLMVHGHLALLSGGVNEPGGFSTNGTGMDLVMDMNEVSQGWFELEGTNAAFSHGERGGWAVIVHGQHDGERVTGGYTIQMDRGYGDGQFVVREWYLNENGDVRERRPVMAVDPPAGYDFEGENTVRVEVDGAVVRMIVNGEEALMYDDLNLESGSFGVRTWHGTELDVTSSQIGLGED